MRRFSVLTYLPCGLIVLVMPVADTALAREPNDVNLNPQI